ncbi:MAG TPA: hypothetical protein VNZ52_12995, partial [Candidatus Thermoplasmatota archaeon]|nr:hypothetical protein [Candidatus Thermoplasmatota archaeon]
MTAITYRAIHPLTLSPVLEDRAKAKGAALDMREESRVLSLSKELHDRLKRWMHDVNRTGRGMEFVSRTALMQIPQSKVGFVPQDRLYIESEGPESVFASDPEAAGPLPTGVAFHATTDPGALAANFDLAPFLESYVRRMSGLFPQFVWQIGDKYYHRTTGLVLVQDPPRFEARRFP